MKHFAIIGCGTAGLSSAIFLARAGHKVTIFERFPEPSAVGAGILIQPSGMEVLRRLGLLESLEQTAARIDELDGRTPAGRRIMNVSYRDLSPDACALGVHRANLLDVLLAASRDAGVNVRCGAEVAEIRQDANGRASLALENGDIAEGFDGVVIANGTQSKLRNALGIPQTCKPYPWGALWAICPAPDAELKPALVQRYAGASVMIGVMPTGIDPETRKPCVSFFWSLKTSSHSEWKRADFQAWKDQVLGYWPEIEPTVASIALPGRLAFATYADVRMRTWNESNIVVIGDAAHGMSPQLGQGANLALIDALTLADCVAAQRDVTSAFSSYSKARRGNLRFYQTASRWLTPLFQSESRFAATLRDWSFPLVNHIPYTRREAVRTAAGLKTGFVFDRSAIEREDRNVSASIASREPDELTAE